MDLFKNLANKLKNTGNKWTQGISNLFSDEPISDAFWDDLEELLILGDVGIDLTETLIKRLKQRAIDERISKTSELRAVFSKLLIEQLQEVKGMGESLDVSSKPAVILMIGVNGSGKTTTAGKLAAQLKKEGKKSFLPQRIHSEPQPSNSSKLGEKGPMSALLHKARTVTLLLLFLTQ